MGRKKNDSVVLKFRRQQVMILPVEKLFVDQENGQRGPITKHISNIADPKNFDEEVVKPFFVNKRADGMYAVLDGQQELNVIKLKGWKEALCVVLDLADKRKEPEKIVKLNNSKAFPVRTKFDNMQRSGAERETTVYNTVLKNGFEIRLRKNQKFANQNVIKAVANLLKIYDEYGVNGQRILDDTLYIIRNAWELPGVPGVVDRDALKDLFILAIARYVDAMEGYTTDELVEVLKPFNPGKLYAQNEGEFKKSRAGLDRVICNFLRRQTLPHITAKAA